MVWRLALGRIMYECGRTVCLTLRVACCGLLRSVAGRQTCDAIACFLACDRRMHAGASGVTQLVVAIMSTADG